MTTTPCHHHHQHPAASISTPASLHHSVIRRLPTPSTQKISFPPYHPDPTAWRPPTGHPARSTLGRKPVHCSHLVVKPSPLTTDVGGLSELGSLLAQESRNMMSQPWRKLVRSADLFKQNDDASSESLPLAYDAEAIANYFAKRPFLVFSRASLMLAEGSLLGVHIMMDLSLGRGQQNEVKRASQLLDLIMRLGPTAIKLGQALSVRTDLLPAPYIEALQKLQDKVPPFSNEEAHKLIFEELGWHVEDMYSELSDQPVAAASLGQVYKARLRASGEPVAVKVQRPRLLEIIALDLYILRSLLTGLHKLSNTYSEFISILDHWAGHLFNELNYTLEAKNAESFRTSMKSLDNVVVPKTYMQYSSRKVLTSSWIEGEKLSESEAGDAAKLVSTALNCYLVQLLETGLLHADPHPGNLLRTSDGRLCVLDFGFMLEVTEDQRYSLVDYILHLINGDYNKAVEDLIKLGFAPSHTSSEEKAKEVLPQFTRVLSQLVKGGGLQKMNVEEVIADLAGMLNDHGITVPPFFAMIIRAFSILEGIGLKSNPDYAMVQECYPYVCKRLLTDDHPRARAALKYFLYGNKMQVNADRVESILRGFQSFRSTMMPVELKNTKLIKYAVDPTSKQVMSSLFAPEGSFLQELLLTELVRIVDALSRAAILELLNGFVSGSSPFSLVIPPFLWNFWNPFGIPNVSSLSDEDHEALQLVRRLVAFLGSQLSHHTVTDMTYSAQGVSILGPDLASGVTTASMRFIIMLLHRKAVRLADDLDGTNFNTLTYWNNDPAAWARHVKPFGFMPFRQFGQDK